jgi:peptidoglycan glycosyltransferase
MGSDGLSAAVVDWRLTEPPSLELPTEAGSWSPENLALETAGQGSLTVSPLRMALVAAALANDGVMPVPQLVIEVKDHQGEWRALARSAESQSILSPDVAQTLLEVWEPYGPRVVGHLGIALAGEGRPPHAWFLGLGPASAPRYAVSVLLEHTSDPNEAAEVASVLLSAAMEK